MKHSFVLFLAALITLAPVAPNMALAKSKVGHCPPGLAKKNPPCIPPGQAKKMYNIGDRYDDHDDRLHDYDRRHYDLPRLPDGQSYYRIGDTFIRVDDETRLVLELIEIFAGMSN